MRLLLIFTCLFFSLNIFAHRIISTLPSVTEMLYFLNLQEQLVGVTPFCNFPAEAKTKEIVGTSFSLDYEKIAILKPSVVILGKTASSPKIKENLDKMKIKYLTVGYDRVKDIFATLTILNNYFGVNKLEKINSLKRSLKLDKKLTPKKILIVIGEQIKDGNILTVQIAGPNTFYDDLIKMTGHKNAARGNAQYITLNLEALMKIPFDAIIRISEKEDSSIKNKWQSTSFKNKVKFLFRDYAVIPGPRIDKLLNDLRGLL